MQATERRAAWSRGAIDGPASNGEYNPSKNERAEPLESRLNHHERLLTPREAANLLRVSNSWLAKARMRGDGPPYVKIGRSIRYPESALLQWMKSRMRLSTSER